MRNNRLITMVFLLVILMLVDTFCIPTFINPLTADFFSETILGSIRFPKVFTAIAAGAALSASGLMLQQLFKNPLAGPYVLGVSSGASLAVGIVIIGGASIPILNSIYVQSIGIAFAGFIGAFGILLLALLVSHRFGYSYILLLFGVIVGQILGAFQTLIDYLANPTDLKQFALWNMGSFYNTIDWSLYTLLLFVTIGIVWSFTLMKPLSIMILGNDVAYTLGVKTKQVSLQILMCTGLLAGVVTAFCGPIAFIGMAVPNVARMVYRTANFKKLLLLNILIGASMALVCDILGNLAIFNFHLPINVSAALIGGPIVLFILLKRKY